MSHAFDGAVSGVNDGVNGNWSYSFDAENRLLAANCSAGCPGGQSGLGLAWSYDRYGNRWTQQVTAGSAPAPGASYAGNNQPAGYSFDAAGNLIADGRCTYTWDGEGRLVGTGGAGCGAAQYKYDTAGRRVWEQVNGVESEFVYGPEGERDSVSANQTITTRELYFAGRPAAVYWNGVTLFPDQDGLGTKRASWDENGGTFECVQGLPFGDGESECGAAGDSDPLHFTGKERDGETGLDYFGARYYNPNLGRFMTPDWSSAPEPVPYADLSNPQSLNLYSYVLNNPVTATDADGHCCEWLKEGVRAAIRIGTGLNVQAVPPPITRPPAIPPPNWQYSQSTGKMTLQVGSHAIDSVGNGYSGKGAGLNNPAMQNVPYRGPIPQGQYEIGSEADHTTNRGAKLSGAMGLTPEPGTNTFGRDAFLIDGDNSNSNHSASEGCIVLCRSARDTINLSHIKLLIRGALAMKTTPARAMRLAILLAFASCMAFPQTRATDIKPNGTTVMAARVGGANIEFELNTAEVPADLRTSHLNPSNAAAHWSCTGSRNPCVITLSAKLTINGAEVRVPPEILIDIGDPVHASFARTGGALSLIISGGDASESYRVVATIASGRITGYRYYSGLDDSHPLFSVQYFPPPVLN